MKGVIELEVLSLQNSQSSWLSFPIQKLEIFPSYSNPQIFILPKLVFNVVVNKPLQRTLNKIPFTR